MQGRHEHGGKKEQKASEGYTNEWLYWGEQREEEKEERRKLRRRDEREVKEENVRVSRDV